MGREHISENVKRGMAAAKSRGAKLGKRPRRSRNRIDFPDSSAERIVCELGYIVTVFGYFNYTVLVIVCIVIIVFIGNQIPGRVIGQAVAIYGVITVRQVIDDIIDVVTVADIDVITVAEVVDGEDLVIVLDTVFSQCQPIETVVTKVAARIAAIMGM
jgi:hypothetical protein